MFRGPRSEAGVLTPNDAGIFLRNCTLPDSVITPDTRDTNDHNCVEIFGTPVKPGLIKINIRGGMFGSMAAPASYFSKEYLLNVVKP